jgi:hypothetical protein
MTPQEDPVLAVLGNITRRFPDLQEKSEQFKPQSSPERPPADTTTAKSDKEYYPKKMTAERRLKPAWKYEMPMNHQTTAADRRQQVSEAFTMICKSSLGHEGRCKLPI